MNKASYSFWYSNFPYNELGEKIKNHEFHKTKLVAFATNEKEKSVTIGFDIYSDPIANIKKFDGYEEIWNFCHDLGKPENPFRTLYLWASRSGVKTKILYIKILAK